MISNFWFWVIIYVITYPVGFVLIAMLDKRLVKGNSEVDYTFCLFGALIWPWTAILAIGFIYKTQLHNIVRRPLGFLIKLHLWVEDKLSK